MMKAAWLLGSALASLAADPLLAAEAPISPGGPSQPAGFQPTIVLDAGWSAQPGTSVYRRDFRWHYGRGEIGERVWLDLGGAAAQARVKVNEMDCGVASAPPCRVEITAAVKEGRNALEIALVNAGRLDSVTLEVIGQAAEPPTAELQRIYDEVKTPFKRGVILQPGPDELFDCPSVFRFGSAWYMLFVSNQHKIGYQTRLARSADLLHWTILGTILPFSGHGWDAAQADGGVALVDPKWNGSAKLSRQNGHYWMSYIGGSLPGYEPDPLSIGLAYTDHPDRPEAWQRLESNPILGPSQPDARPWEQATLYKSTIVHDPARTLGAPFVMFYNGKQKGPWIERIGSAVSDDLVHWRRTIAEPAVDNGRGISGDPQLVRMGELWVMFYFGAGWGKGARAFDTFAISRDLVHWQKWTGPNLIAPTESWDATYAHKPWLLKHGGVVYHFYCSVAGDNRAIALATSRELAP